MSLGAGDLKTRGILQRRSNTSDAQGGQTVAWVNVATIWAEIKAKTGTETVTADRQFPMVTYDITIRFLAGVVGSAYGADASMRFYVAPRIFDIRSVVDVDEAHEALLLGCELYEP
jgi:SPP1 family predicted phage head-tail adaptor